MSECDIWYHVYPLGFLAAEDRNPAPGATAGPVTHRLPALVAWLDYLVELGVTGLLLGPVFESESHGYDVVDPYRVDRRLGTEADLIVLIDECHRRSLRVGLDTVLHHVGREHPHFRDVLAHRDQSAWRDWFEIDFRRGGRDGFSYANFEGHDQLVKLNHTNREVLAWASDTGSYWLERGVDALRLDAAYAILPGFLAEFSDRMRELRPDVLLVGEVIHGDYVRMARAGHLTTVTQYELWKAIWSSLNDGNFFELAHSLERHAAVCQHFPPWNFVGNHDTTRIATQLLDKRHLPHALVILFSLPGIPAVYSGDEQGAKGRKYDRAGGDARIRRAPRFRPDELTGESLETWSLHRDLIAIRRARPWLTSGKLRVTRLENLFIAYEVSSSAGRLAVALNTDEHATRWNVPAGLVPVAGHADDKLPPRAWGIWASP